jgi:hypothetical protein
MKKISFITYRTILLGFILFIRAGWGNAQEQGISGTSAQRYMDLINPLSSLGSCDRHPVYTDSQVSPDRLLSPLRRIQPGSMYSVQERWDTIGLELIPVPVLINSEGGGYISGNNFFGDLAKANYINQPWASSYITGVLLWFGYAAGNAESWIEVAIWNDSGGPFQKIGSEYIILGDVMVDVFFSQMTWVEFSTPVANPGTYYAGIVLPGGAADTVALYSSRIDDLAQGNAWEMWSDGNWYPVSYPDGWNLELTFGIFPVEYTPTSVNEQDDNTPNFLFDIYPNPASGQFFIELKKTLPGMVRLDMYDITGNKVHRELLDNTGNRRYLVADPGRLARGVYIIRLSAGGETGVRSLMVL